MHRIYNNQQLFCNVICIRLKNTMTLGGLSHAMNKMRKSLGIIIHHHPISMVEKMLRIKNVVETTNHMNISWYIYNYMGKSLTWIKAIRGWFPLLTMIPVRSQWGRSEVVIIYPDIWVCNWMVNTKLDQHLWSPRSSILTHIHGGIRELRTGNSMQENNI